MKYLLFSVLFPICVLLAWCVQLESNIGSGELIRIKAVGYDPRDLLSGHYLRFRVDTGYVLPCDANLNGPVCVCLMPGEMPGFHEAMWAGKCEDRPKCDAFLKGQCDSGRFSTGIDRYFIAEKYSSVLATVPGDSSVLLSVKSDGSAALKKFMVGEEDIEQYAERRLNEQAATTPPIP